RPQKKLNQIGSNEILANTLLTMTSAALFMMCIPSAARRFAMFCNHNLQPPSAATIICSSSSSSSNKPVAPRTGMTVAGRIYHAHLHPSTRPTSQRSFTRSVRPLPLSPLPATPPCNLSMQPLPPTCNPSVQFRSTPPCNPATPQP
ncbi:unnamed protein product, partial [Laminaria digitata]